MREIKLQDLKAQTPQSSSRLRRKKGSKMPATMRKQELMFAILKQLAIQEIDIIGEGVVEVLSDGFGFLRSPDANLPAPALTTSTFRRRRSGVSVFGPATPSRAIFAARRKANVISRC